MWPRPATSPAVVAAEIMLQAALEFGRHGEHARAAVRRVEKAAEEFERWRRDLIFRMDAAPQLADEWSFEMNSQNFCRWSRVGPFERLTVVNIAGDRRQAADGFFRRRGDGGGDDRSGAEARHGFGDPAQRFGSAFHHVMAARAVNVYVHKSGRNDHAGGDAIVSAGGDFHFIAMSDRGDFPVFDNHDPVGDGFVRGENLAGVDDERIHGGVYGTRSETRLSHAQTRAFPKANGTPQREFERVQPSKFNPSKFGN